MINDEMIKKMVPGDMSYLLTEFLRVRLDCMDNDPTNDFIGKVFRDSCGDSAVIPHGLFKSMMIFYVSQVSEMGMLGAAEASAKEFMTKLFVSEISEFLSMCVEQQEVNEDVKN